MALAVAWQKHQFAIAEFAAHELIGRLAERRCHRHFAHSFESVHLIKTAAADDADDWMSHKNLDCRASCSGADKFPLRLPLKLTASRGDIVTPRASHIDLNLVIKKHLLESFHGVV